LQDEKFVQQIEDENRTRELLTFQSTIEAIEEVYDECCEDIMCDFVDMLFFDAITGNNDRHFENWGVIEDVRDPSATRFSPIYDTARGMFWNFSEERLATLMHDDKWINAYIDGSLPATSWDHKEELNHFGLIKFLLNEYPEYCSTIDKFNFSGAIKNVNNLINREFRDLFSKNRRLLQRKYLTKRIRKLQEIVQDHVR
jgi:hypothetical protein